MDFVEDFYPYLVKSGLLLNKCPSVMLKHLVESGAVELVKGAIAKLHEDAKRGQALNVLRWRSRKPTADAIRDNSVDKKEMMAIVESHTKVTTQPVTTSVDSITGQFALAL